jgi:hypothetical protein
LTGLPIHKKSDHVYVPLHPMLQISVTSATGSENQALAVRCVGDIGGCLI